MRQYRHVHVCTRVFPKSRNADPEAKETRSQKERGGVLTKQTKMSGRYSRGAQSSQTQKKQTTEKNQQILRKLLNDPANKYCADCKVTQHPRWASWSLGIFLCIRCSGIHRGMGTHISKVRSIDLDSWSDEHMEKMITWGNRRANLYWKTSCRKITCQMTPRSRTSSVPNMILSVGSCPAVCPILPR